MSSAGAAAGAGPSSAAPATSAAAAAAAGAFAGAVGSGGAGGTVAAGRSLAEDLAIALSFPNVEARVWLSVTGVSVKLLPSYSSFFFAVINTLVVGPAARLYWFPDERSPISDRRPLCDEATFSAFRKVWSAGLRPIVWAYTPPSADTPPSAESSRSLDQPPSAALPVAVAPAKPASSGGSRDSGLQREFRSALEARDGKSSCVACRKAGPAEAAHLLRRGTAPPILASAGLLSAWDVRNGVMLCSVCHFTFDKFFWCVGADGTIVVSEALLSDEERRGHFAPLVGSALRHVVGDVHWPRDATWALHRQLFEAARHNEQLLRLASKFVCDDCGALFQTSGSWRYHAEVEAACSMRTRKGRKQLWTPLERRAFPLIASADEAALAARRLSMVGEGGDAKAAKGERGDGAGDGSDSESAGEGSDSD